MRKIKCLAKRAVLVVGLGAGILVSAVLYVATQRMIENSARLDFKYQASNAQFAIDARIADYAEVLQGLSALFRTTDR